MAKAADLSRFQVNVEKPPAGKAHRRRRVGENVVKVLCRLSPKGFALNLKLRANLTCSRPRSKGYTEKTKARR